MQSRLAAEISADTLSDLEVSNLQLVFKELVRDNTNSLNLANERRSRLISQRNLLLEALCTVERCESQSAIQELRSQLGLAGFHPGSSSSEEVSPSDRDIHGNKAGPSIAGDAGSKAPKPSAFAAGWNTIDLTSSSESSSEAESLEMHL